MSVDYQSAAKPLGDRDVKGHGMVVTEDVRGSRGTHVRPYRVFVTHGDQLGHGLHDLVLVKGHLVRRVDAAVVAREVRLHRKGPIDWARGASHCR